MLTRNTHRAGHPVPLSQDVPINVTLGLPRFRSLEILLDLIEHAGGADK